MENFIQVVVNGTLISGLYALIAVGLTLIFGVMRVINFAHGEFMMLGGYTTYWLFVLLRLDPLLSLLISMVVLAGLGLIVQRCLINPVLGASSLNQILLTFGLAIILQNVAMILWTSDYVSVQTWYSTHSLRVGFVRISVAKLGIFFMAIILMMLLGIILKKTETGKVLRAVSQDPQTAQLMGIDINRAYMIAFAIGTGLAGLAGAATSTVMSIFPTVGVEFIMKAFAIVVFGGLGSVAGACLASFILGVTESLVGTYVPGGGGWAEAVSFTVLILVLIFRPKGIFSS
ncbi:MAG: branched-chain amino acid ABC transporter permease [Deltaproteobacteria bacterium]|nr:branched-chain amino acid ABC transporter permease [Deltaproteobacteria bacterium]